jgi:tetratricopeptide (TPR) repeat protein
LNNRGLAHFYASSFDTAIRDFTDAIRLCKDDPAIWFNRGNVHLKMNTEQSIELALKDYETAISISPYNSVYFHSKGLAKQSLMACIEDRLRKEYFDTLKSLRVQKRAKTGRSKSRENPSHYVPVPWQTLAQ